MTRAFPPTLGNRLTSLPDSLYREVWPDPLPTPRLLHWNREAAALAGISASNTPLADLAAWLAGNRPWPGSRPLASVYAGHQFGYFVPQLGDGRAILLGETSHRG